MKNINSIELMLFAALFLTQASVATHATPALGSNLFRDKELDVSNFQVFVKNLGDKKFLVTGDGTPGADIYVLAYSAGADELGKVTVSKHGTFNLTVTSWHESIQVGAVAHVAAGERIREIYTHEVNLTAPGSQAQSYCDWLSPPPPEPATWPCTIPAK
ncbi:hypothetical protein [Stenotrophomonas maltophilia]|uniref:hypothetical protein n=1 Tax=Stenotrophomonas maltophilia TaxID=40324 RepID=UPI0015C54A8A|nr:hypothetical protein [Stenotrophomonas maltophilia]